MGFKKGIVPIAFLAAAVVGVAVFASVKLFAQQADNRPLGTIGSKICLKFPNSTLCPNPSASPTPTGEPTPTATASATPSATASATPSAKTKLPAILSILPLNVGPYSGDITIQGSNFGNNQGKVHFTIGGNIVGGTQIKSWSNTQIDACDISVPSPNQNYGVKVQTSGGLLSQAYSYFVGPSASISTPLPCPQ